MSFALKLALVILIIHFKLHGLNAATLIDRYKTAISNSDSTDSRESYSHNNSDNDSKNNYARFDSNVSQVHEYEYNDNGNQIIDNIALPVTIANATTTTTTINDWHIQLPLQVINGSNNDNNDHNNDTNSNNAELPLDQTKLLCDNDGKYASNRCDRGRNIHNNKPEPYDSDEPKNSNSQHGGTEKSKVENENTNSNNNGDNLTIDFISVAQAAATAQTSTTKIIQSAESTQNETKTLQNYYQYNLTVNGNDKQERDASNITTIFDETIIVTTPPALEFQPTESDAVKEIPDEIIDPGNPLETPIVPSTPHDVLDGLDSLLGAQDLEKYLLQYKTELNNNCLMDGMKDIFQWWSYSNGTLNTNGYESKKAETYSLNSYYMDFSYQNLTDDENLHKLALEKKLRIGRSVYVFSAAHNNLTQIPFLTLSTINGTLQYLTLKGNDFKAHSEDCENVESKRPPQNFPPTHFNEDDIYENDMENYIENDINAAHERTGFRHLLEPKRPQEADPDAKGIAWATFPKLPYLMELDISNCHIENIAQEAFRNITGIRKLFMSRNKMNTIPQDAFNLLSQLEYLDLAYTNLLDFDYQLPHPTLAAAVNLIYGVKIQSSAFRKLKKLKYLDMSHTQITRTSAMAFAHLGSSLEYMSLCYTSFPLIGNALFKKTRLIGLDLSGNPYTSFVDDAFESIADTLQYLFFEGSNIKELGWLKHLVNARVLGLARNNINMLSSEYFVSLKNLEAIDLSANNIGNWYSRVFTNNTLLRALNLRNNNINILNSEMLEDFKQLDYLGIGENNFICDCSLSDLVEVAAINNKKAECSKTSTLDDVPQLVYDNLEDLSRFFMPTIMARTLLRNLKRSFENLGIYNKARYLPRMRLAASIGYSKLRTAFEQTDECEVIDLPNNDALLNGTAPKFQLIDYEFDHYWCFNGTNRMQLVQLDCQGKAFDVDIAESLNELTKIVVASICSIMGLTLLLVIIYLKRWHIYYYYSSLKSAALLSVAAKDQVKKFNELAESDPSMVYDIFISYCQSDRDWVLEELLPNVEESGNISICLHERDFQIGVAILENIISCMDRSRALMLIVSSNFLLSHWCQFEMHLAQHRIFEVSKEHLIIVFLEDIPRSKRPKTLQYLMEVKTYIKWPGAKGREVKPEERKYFWKRLRRSLEHLGITPTESQA
ncbi:unnamed protein product [Ceratitis capitata]|uniref:(Mediterranean fruit fly) hypothetical protein n=1 Tax=Ceratitis capitata TaxID=7213 RepID=A0A811V5S8_CERCA|nr:unnamed protein product [Ceratitis capitata]